MLQPCQDAVTFTQNIITYFLLYLGGRRSPKGGAPPFSPIRYHIPTNIARFISYLSFGRLALYPFFFNGGDLPHSPLRGAQGGHGRRHRRAVGAAFPH